jgi:hypothetical protein
MIRMSETSGIRKAGDRQLKADDLKGLDRREGRGRGTGDSTSEERCRGLYRHMMGIISNRRTMGRRLAWLVRLAPKIENTINEINGDDE